MVVLVEKISKNKHASQIAASSVCSRGGAYAQRFGCASSAAANDITI